MRKIITICLSALALSSTACGNYSITNQSDSPRVVLAAVEPPQQKNEDDESQAFKNQVEFERTYTPIVQSELKRLFPPSSPTESPFKAYGVMYLDTKDKDMNNMKFVFLLDQPESPLVKELEKSLKAKMGKHVEFRPSKHNQKKLKEVQDGITKLLEKKELVGGWGVGIDTIKEKVRVSAYIDESLQKEIIKKYGFDLVDIEIHNTYIDIKGYVIDKKDNEILVVNPEKQKTNDSGHSYQANWYSNAPSDIDIGNIVEVTVVNGAKISMYQYPDRDEALEVKVLQSSQLSEKQQTEFESVRKALESEIK
ncbi:DUF3221 domain-containing protein [Paenibacillus sp. GCM10023252]|uniref:DUF3221 domain-containing protein n=1 Tax=Paenibacillus sp. GCM10023252 TaxID=3252649 RepID=UPI003618099F